MLGKKEFCNLISRIISRAATVALAIATVFALTVVLTQSAQAQTFKVIHTFTGGADGRGPYAGLTADAAGNFYGTTGGYGTGGTAFKLSKKGSGWVFNPLYAFRGGSDGAYPTARVIFGPDGSLYGTTVEGGVNGCFNGCGTVFNLKPPATACKTALCPWTETVLYRFTGGSDGGQPSGVDLTFDQLGNIYGTTGAGGYQGGDCSASGGCGVVFELTPSNGGWTESVIYTFTGGSDGASPAAGVIFDQAGNLYGTTWTGGNPGCFAGGCGTVFELTPSGSGWVVKVLYSFQGGSDGGDPNAGLMFDGSGNLYGTTTTGGLDNDGTVFELTPSGGGWTFDPLYSFTGIWGSSGSLVMDASGNLYGTTTDGGAYGYGSVFKLTPSGGSWTYTSLHDFPWYKDGGTLYGNVIFDASGNLYGTASAGGLDTGYGTVWEITP